MKKWQQVSFDDRQQAEIEFCRVYANKFGHGTDGHNAKLIIARFAEMMDAIEPIAAMLLDEVRKPSNESQSIYLTYELASILQGGKSNLNDIDKASIPGGL